MVHLLALAALLTQTAPDVFRELQRSHIEANVPAPEDFDRMLTRDLEAYFKTRLAKVVRVKAEPLRDAPTQSGVAYPKFYMWVQAFEGTVAVEQGAVRVEARERKQFDVTHFVSETEIRANPAALSGIFPAPVCERIKAKLRMNVSKAS